MGAMAVMIQHPESFFYALAVGAIGVVAIAIWLYVRSSRRRSRMAYGSRRP